MILNVYYVSLAVLLAKVIYALVRINVLQTANKMNTMT